VSAAAELVSIITPTRNRAALLPLAHRCVAGQSWANLEWLVLDDSPEPSPYMAALDDPRVTYTHDPAPQTVGAKRNRLVEAARGTIIAHFDDDDFYAPGYLGSMVAALTEQDAGIAKLLSFFLYDRTRRQLGYWDLTVKRGFHFVWEGRKTGAVADLPEAPFRDNHLGYGFSYVYRRSAWEESRFEDRNWNEDTPFIQQVQKRRGLAGVHDREGLALHVHHGKNTSKSFPQYRLPAFLLERLFPEAGAYLEALHREPPAP